MRVVEIDGQPWFIAADVCVALGIHVYGGKVLAAQAVRKLASDEQRKCQIPTSSQRRSMIAVSESGLYKLIMRSDKPEGAPLQLT